MAGIALREGALVIVNHSLSCLSLSLSFSFALIAHSFCSVLFCAVWSLGACDVHLQLRNCPPFSPVITIMPLSASRTVKL
ncbi:hypothetical protein E2542_SST06603 [Spatholobus suberectus]|nr:hypothetical protein E2542_SST06603 [Spatholobus suberectus]